MHPETRVLFMSGYARDAIEHRDIHLTSANYIQKPFLASSLALKVREILDSQSGML
jgi:hypothetical protein